MTTHDDDIIDFDFFDESPTREAALRGRSRRGSGGQGPRAPRVRPGGSAPLIRLVGLVAFAILVVVLVVVAVQGWTQTSTRDRYADYMGQLGRVGADSAKRGARLADLLTTPGLKQAELETKLQGLVDEEELGVSQAAKLTPPGPLQSEHEAVLEALGFRVAGLQGLLAVFVATKDSNDAAAAGQALAAQGQRLITSDIVWHDLFQAPAKSKMVPRGIEDVAAPVSTFVESEALFAPDSLEAIWQRIHGASTGGTLSGLHGTGLASVKTLPSGQTLSASTETTILASTDLVFEVGVTNTGDNQEVKIEVTLTIPADPTPIVKRQTIDVLEPGDTKTVAFTDLGEVPISDPTTVKVDVKPVAGEKNTANNTAEYPVIFSLE